LKIQSESEVDGFYAELAILQLSFKSCALSLIYNALNERDETLVWLERSFKERDPKMTFLKVEPKWNNLRNELRFIELMRRMNFE